MRIQQNLRFGEFTLDRENQELRRDSLPIVLPPKTFAVLRYLTENSQRLVTQAELLKGVWGAVAVGEGLLRGYIRDLRQALGDEAGHPRFIETIPRRGFRFISQVTTDAAPPFLSELDEIGQPRPASGLVGRDRDLLQLHLFLKSALGGKRQVVFVPGEAGIGKTALVAAFLDQARSIDSLLVARGQCIEQFGAGEPYLPLFDALGTLCRGPHATDVLGVLSRHAPVWLSQMPGIVPDAQFEALQRKVQGSTQSRMLRELCDAFEVMAADHPLIFALEDLQWSDPSTLDLISTFARRPQSARLMLIGTYRPADVIVSAHPLKIVTRELQAHGLCHELCPDCLSESAVRQYLADRFPGHRFPSALGQLIHRNTGGNPLFMTAMVEDLLRRKAIDKAGGYWQLSVEPEEIASKRPESLRQLIEGQLDRLSAPEQRILEAAAAVGSEFTARLVAAALETDTTEVAERCDDLVRQRQFLNVVNTLASNDQTDDSRYAFRHDLYRSAAFDRSSPSRLILWYRRIGEKMIADCGEHLDELSTELAYYFEHAKLFQQAAQYYALAGERAIRRFANSEAIGHFRRGVELLEKAPSSVERDELELRLQVDVALPLVAIQGQASDEVTAVLSRARDLNQKLGETPQTFGAIRALHWLSFAHADYRGAFELCEQLSRIAERVNNPDFRAEALRARANSSLYLGQLTDSRELFERVLSICDREDRGAQVFADAEDPGVPAAGQLAIVLWMLGYPDQALATVQGAVASARALAAPFMMAVTQSFLASLLRLLRDIPATLEAANAAIAICDDQGFAFWRAQAAVDRGWAIAMQGHPSAGIKEAKLALVARRSGSEAGAAGVTAKLVDACLHAGKTRQGLHAVADALTFARNHEERALEPELHRLKGELLLQRAKPNGAKKRSSARDLDEAEGCFSAALAHARESAAKSLELRAAISMHRLWSRQNKRKEAHRILADVYGWFTEGLNTPDLVEARRLLHGR